MPSRKGISEIVATVLLIAFTVTIASIVSIFINGYFSSNQQLVPAEVWSTCVKEENITGNLRTGCLRWAENVTYDCMGGDYYKWTTNNFTIIQEAIKLGSCSHYNERRTCLQDEIKKVILGQVCHVAGLNCKNKTFTDVWCNGNPAWNSTIISFSDEDYYEKFVDWFNNRGCSPALSYGVGKVSMETICAAYRSAATKEKCEIQTSIVNETKCKEKNVSVKDKCLHGTTALVESYQIDAIKLGSYYGYISYTDMITAQNFSLKNIVVSPDKDAIAKRLSSNLCKEQGFDWAGRVEAQRESNIFSITCVNFTNRVEMKFDDIVLNIVPETPFNMTLVEMDCGYGDCFITNRNREWIVSADVYRNIYDYGCSDWSYRTETFKDCKNVPVSESKQFVCGLDIYDWE